jgi:putative addiction module component (TIGR02574 family)
MRAVTVQILHPELENLSVSDRVALAEALWASVAAESDGPSLSAAKAAELRRRVEELDQNPENVVPWSEIRKEALAGCHAHRSG